MTRQVILRPAPEKRRQPFVIADDDKVAPRERRRVGEMAGGTTAECVAVCCCCPCAVMKVLVLAAYKVPAGLVKKAMHERKRQRQRVLKKKKKNEALLQQRPSSVESENVGPTLEEHLSKEKEEVVAEEGGDAAENTEAVELEEEMWAQFNGTGFWRSSSQRQAQLQPVEKDRVRARGSTLANASGIRVGIPLAEVVET